MPALFQSGGGSATFFMKAAPEVRFGSHSGAFAQVLASRNALPTL